MLNFGRPLAVMVVSLLFILALSQALTPSGFAQQVEIGFDFGSSVPADVRASFQETARSFMTLVAGTFRQPMRQSATIHAYATWDSLVEAWSKWYQTDRTAAERGLGGPSTSAVTHSTRQDVWFNLSAPCFRQETPSPGCNLKKILIHEMFHLWQHEFGERGRPPAIPPWIHEGSAEFAGFLLGPRAGAFSAQDGTNYLRSAVLQTASDLPRLSEMHTSSGWQSWLQRAQGLYQVVAYAVFRLAEDRPENISTFYAEVAGGKNWEDAFQTAFGRPFLAFEQEFTSHVRQLAQAPSTSRVVGDGIIIPARRIGPAVLGMTVDDLSTLIGPPTTQGTAPPPGSQGYAVWFIADDGYGQYGQGGPRLEVWTPAGSRSISEIRVHSTLFRTSGGNRVGVAPEALREEFPELGRGPWSPGTEVLSTPIGISFVVRLSAPQVVVAIVVERPRR